MRTGKIDIPEQHKIEWQVHGPDPIIVAAEIKSCAAVGGTRIDKLEGSGRKIRTGRRGGDGEYRSCHCLSEYRNGDRPAGCSERNERSDCIGRCAEYSCR